jgi:hypothetical protein
MPRVIGGICEHCGIPAVNCPHFQGKPLPMDYREQLAMSDNAPLMPKVSYEPIREDEKAKSIEEMNRRKDAIFTNLVEPENTEL